MPLKSPPYFRILLELLLGDATLNLWGYTQNLGFTLQLDLLDSSPHHSEVLCISDAANFDLALQRLVVLELLCILVVVFVVVVF